MRTKRWRLAFGLLAALIVGLLALKSGGGEAPSSAAGPVADSGAMKPAGSAASGLAASPWALIQQSSVQADQSEADAARQKAWLLDPRNDSAWCERGPSAVQASLTAYRRSSDGGANKPTGPAFDALNETTEALLQRWAAQLATRGDEDSLAMSDFLVARVGGYDMQTGKFQRTRDQARTRAAHLSALAQRSERPFVQWLAASLACGDRQMGSPACKQVLDRWVQVQPGSLDAMLWQLAAIPKGTDEAAIEAVFARALANNDNSSHALQYMGLLQGLLSASGSPGLRQVAERKLMIDAQFSVEMPRAFGFVEHCRDSRSSVVRGHCLAAAERIYDREYQGTLARMVAVVVARDLGGDEQRWVARHEEMEQTQQWLRKDPGHSFDGPALETMVTGNCQAEPLRQAMLDRMKHDELGLMRLAQARRAERTASGPTR